MINTLERDIRDMLNKYEVQVFRVRTAADFGEVQKALQNIVARLSRLRRTEPAFLQFLGGLLVMFTNMKYDDTLAHNICWYDIGDGGKLRWGRKKEPRNDL